jgi:hypothetical protein
MGCDFRDAPKWYTSFSKKPVFMHLLEHPFSFRHRNQRIMQATVAKYASQGTQPVPKKQFGDFELKQL